MSELEKRLPAECDALPSAIVQDADKIYSHVVSGEPTPIVWQGDTDDPFRLEVVASLSPESKRSTYGHKKMDDLPVRLRLESRFQLPLSFGSSGFEGVRATYLHKLHEDPGVRRLVDARFTNNKLNTLQLNPLGEKDTSVVTYAPASKVGPYVVWLTNDRNTSSGFAPDRAPYFNKDNIRSLISTYLGLTWLIGSVLGDPRIPKAALLDRYDKGSDSFYRKTGGSRPRPKTAFSNELTPEKRSAYNESLSKLREKYSPPAGIESVPLDRDHIYNLDLDDLDQINVRVDAIREPERARQWGLTGQGGIVVVGEKGSGKSTLALSIADQADIPLFFWPSDMIHADDSSQTAKQITRLRDIIKFHAHGSDTLGIVLEGMQMLQHASPVEVEEVSRLVRQAASNPNVLLVGTMTVEDIDRDSPKYDLIKQGLFGHGLFSSVISMGVSEQMMGNAITRLFTDEMVHGQRMFDDLTHEKHDSLLQYTYGHFSISEMKVAMEVCKGRKFLEQRRLGGQHPGAITIHDVIKALEDGTETKHKSGRNTFDGSV